MGRGNHWAKIQMSSDVGVVAHKADAFLPALPQALLGLQANVAHFVADQGMWFGNSRPFAHGRVET